MQARPAAHLLACRIAPIGLNPVCGELHRQMMRPLLDHLPRNVRYRREDSHATMSSRERGRLLGQELRQDSFPAFLPDCYAEGLCYLAAPTAESLPQLLILQQARYRITQIRYSWLDQQAV